MLQQPIEPTKFFDWTIVKNQIALSTPIIFQSVVGIGSWLVFFFLIENMGREALEISTLLRSVYMMFMIPAWGFGSGINTIVSNLIGKNQREMVMRVIHKTALLCFITTMICAAVLALAPHWIFGIITTNVHIIDGAVPMLWMFALILATFSTGAIYFNGIIGTGATYQSLFMQVGACVFYLVYAFLVTKVFQVPLSVAWGGEALYWIITLLLSIWYLRSNRWASITV
jgi:Na+-driven multidrug efflux pump